MQRQLRRLGLAHDDRRSFATIDPDFMKWTQWITMIAIFSPVACGLMYGIVWLIFRLQHRPEDENSSKLNQSRWSK